MRGFDVHQFVPQAGIDIPDAYRSFTMYSPSNMLAMMRKPSEPRWFKRFMARRLNRFRRHFRRCRYNRKDEIWHGDLSRLQTIESPRHVTTITDTTKRFACGGHGSHASLSRGAAVRETAPFAAADGPGNEDSPRGMASGTDRGTRCQ